MAVLAGKVFVFVYLWYGTPASDGQWQHWDHEVLPHWRAEENARHPTVGTRHAPPDVVHSPFYPLRGPYSSTDPALLDEHFAEIASLDPEVVAVLSWWGRGDLDGTSDTQGVQTDDRVGAALAAAARHGVRVAFHLEPYPGRSPSSVAEDVRYLHQQHNHSTALLREPGRGLVFFVYDSYHQGPREWAPVLSALRGTAHDGVFVGLWLDRHHGRDLAQGGFDAAYTYFAADGFSFGSSSRHWPNLCREATELGLACVLSVGPGYADDRIRPWNKHNGRPRRGGRYYDESFQKALAARPTAVSVTSYNEWGEGTQIEPAVARTDARGPYLDYGQGGPYLYINKTKMWFARFHDQRRQRAHAEL